MRLLLFIFTSVLFAGAGQAYTRVCHPFQNSNAATQPCFGQGGDPGSCFAPCNCNRHPKLFSEAWRSPCMGSHAASCTQRSLHRKRQNVPQDEKAHRFGYSFFAGVGQAANDQASGVGYGLSGRGHYGIHTLNAYGAHVSTFSLSGKELSERRDLQGTYAGFTYGLGLYTENITFSVGAGLGCSTVRMRLGAGTSLQKIYYERYGACIGGQFSVHGKYLGWGFQYYANITQPQINTVFLTGFEIRIW